MVRFVAYLQIMMMLSSPFALAGRLSPEIGAIGLKDWTKDEDLKHPYGIGFYLFQPVSNKVKLTFEFDYLTSRVEDRIYLYDYYYPPSERSMSAKVIRRNHVILYQIGFRHLISRSGSTSLEFGGGFCLVHAYDKTRMVDSDEHWSSPDMHKFGPFLDIGLLVDMLRDLPLTMRFGFRHRFVAGGGATYPTGGGSVSSDPLTTTEVSWGFGYQFGR
jgi:hypothetical protein